MVEGFSFQDLEYGDRTCLPKAWSSPFNSSRFSCHRSDKLRLLLEKIVNVRLIYFLEQGGHLSPAQWGFRRSHSTLDAPFRLKSTDCEAFLRKQHFVVLFFDLDKATDIVW